MCWWWMTTDDNKAILSALRLLLPSYFAEVTLLSSPNDLMHSIETKRPEVVLLDMNFTAKVTTVTTGNEGLFWLGEIKKTWPELPVVLFTAYSDVALAVDAIKRGAFDFVIKPFDNAKLLSTLQAALQLSRSRQEVKQLREIKNEIRSEGQMYWGDSPKMRELRSIVQKVARTDAGCWQGRYTVCPAAAATAWSASMWARCPRVCSRASCSATSRGLSPMPALTGPASSRWLPEARCFWTR